MKKVTVNDDICIGCGFCCASSDIFDMNDDDRAFAKECDLNNMSEEEIEEIMDIKDGCPVGAINVDDQD